MFSAILAIAVLVEPGSSSDPAGLVEQLGSTRYALRVSAEGELARLGRSALPALRAARDSKDAEIRTRAISLVSRIEQDLLLQATPIGLDFRDVPLAEAIESIGRQAGPGLSLAPDERPTLAGRRITLRSHAPLPFWEAIDSLCSAGDLHPSTGDRADRGGVDGLLVLLDGPRVVPGLVSDDRAFRVVLSSVHYQSEIQLAPSVRGSQPDASGDGVRPVDRATREFYLQLALTAEPRLAIARDGPVRVISAVDDQGRSLSSPADPGTFRQSSGYFGLNPSSLLRLRVDLSYPEPPSHRIKVLRGVIPVIVAARKSDPLVVPLAGSRGKLFRDDEVALTLIDHRAASNDQPSTIQVAIRPLGAVENPIRPGHGEPLAYRPDSFQQQIEVIDAQGRPLPWFPSSSFYDGEETRLTMTVGTRVAPGAPATLRYHGLLSARSEVAFEFRDVPIP
jgi:hypothetical protein